MPVSDVARALIRKRAGEQMTDAVTVRRNPDDESMDPDTLLVTIGTGTVVYTGKARCAVAVAGGTISVGEGQLAQQQLSVSLPHDAPTVNVDDTVTIDTSADPQLTGEVWRVVGAQRGGGIVDSNKLACAATVSSRYWVES